MTQTTKPEDMTPVQIDTQLAAIHRSITTIQRSVKSWTERAHRAVDDRKIGSGRGVTWKREDHDVLAEVERLALREPTVFDRYDYRKIVGSIRALEDNLAELTTERRRYDNEYDRRPWNRFFVVTSSNDGHIHSSTSCQTCRVTTDFGWLPQLSGKTEADAVAEHGPRLCSVCFPTAPVEWTAGSPRPVRCPGVDQPATDVKRFPRVSYGTCQGCGERHPVNSNGRPRAHKPVK
jgi:hypothetical protein